MTDPLNMDDTGAVRVLEYLRNVVESSYWDALHEQKQDEANEAAEQIAAIDRAMTALFERMKRTRK